MRKKAKARKPATRRRRDRLITPLWLTKESLRRIKALSQPLMAGDVVRVKVPERFAHADGAPAPGGLFTPAVAWDAAKARRALLAVHRVALLEYLDGKRRLFDWHGVADAAMDLREVDAELAGLDRFLFPATTKG